VIQLGYQIALAALTTAILLKGTWPMRRTIATVFLNMLAAWPLSNLWPGVEWAMAMMLIDAIACLVITWHPAGKWQSIIGLSYIIQIAVHIGRIFNGDNADMDSYWWGLSMLAILQVLLIGGWWLNDGLGLRLGWRRYYPVLVPARRESVAR
jgi:hypothetical protein